MCVWMDGWMDGFESMYVCTYVRSYVCMYVYIGREIKGQIIISEHLKWKTLIANNISVGTCRRTTLIDNAPEIPSEI